MRFSPNQRWAYMDGSSLPVLTLLKLVQPIHMLGLFCCIIGRIHAHISFSAYFRRYSTMRPERTETEVVETRQDSFAYEKNNPTLCQVNLELETAQEATKKVSLTRFTREIRIWLGCMFVRICIWWCTCRFYFWQTLYCNAYKTIPVFYKKLCKSVMGLRAL